MKAKEYVEKYKIKIESKNKEERDNAIKALYSDMLNETIEILKLRKIQKNKAFASLIKEQNGKWNAIAAQIPALKIDGFQNAVKDAYKNEY